jgi:hypothetical protein
MEINQARATSLASADLEPLGDVGEHPADRQPGVSAGPTVERQPMRRGGALALTVWADGEGFGPAPEPLGQRREHPLKAQVRRRPAAGSAVKGGAPGQCDIELCLCGARKRNSDKGHFRGL